MGHFARERAVGASALEDRGGREPWYAPVVQMRFRAMSAAWRRGERAVVAAVLGFGLGGPAAAAEPGPAAEGEGEGEVEVEAVAEPAAPTTSPGSEGPARDAPTSAPPMIEVEAQDRRVRHDWYVGFGFGGGVGIDRRAGIGGAVGFGGGGFIHAGGRIRDAVAMGVRVINAGAKDLGVSGLLAEALFFPLPRRGLRIGAAVGPGAVWAIEQRTAAAAERTNAAALGAAFDVGYDFWLLRRLNLGLELFGMSGIARRAQVASFGLGVSLNWY